MKIFIFTCYYLAHCFLIAALLLLYRRMVRRLPGRRMTGPMHLIAGGGFAIFGAHVIWIISGVILTFFDHGISMAHPEDVCFDPYHALVISTRFWTLWVGKILGALGVMCFAFSAPSPRPPTGSQ